MNIGDTKPITRLPYDYLKQATSYISTPDHIFLQGAGINYTKPNHNPSQAHCFLACSGISLTIISTGTPFSSGQQQNTNSNSH